MTMTHKLRANGVKATARSAAIILGACLLVGCLEKKIMLTNLTAPEFPATGGMWIQQHPGAEALERQVREVGIGAEKNRFHLGVQWSGTDGTDIQAFISVDGVEHAMTKGSWNAWYFDPVSVCQHYAPYSYWFRATGQAGVKLLGTAQEPFLVKNPYGAAVYWFAPGLTTGFREVGRVVDDYQGYVDIVLRNVSGRQVSFQEATVASKSSPMMAVTGVPEVMPHGMSGCEDVTLRVHMDNSGSPHQTLLLRLVVVDFGLPPGTPNASSQLQALATIEFNREGP